MNKAGELWSRVQGSLWFVPGVTVLLCVGLALVLLDAHLWLGADLPDRWPRLFGAGAEGARSMLSGIAGTVMTVAGVVFSVTILALAQASSQYSPRVLRTFMSDRPTQIVLGVFVGIFAYCLIVLRTIRSADEGPSFIPVVAVFGGMVLALVGVGVLIFFIHHVASSIQASSILARVMRDTTEAIDKLYPESIGEPVEPDAGGDPELPDRWVPVAAPRSGYLVSLDDEALMNFAVEGGRVVRLAHVIGDFVIEGLPLAFLAGTEAPAADEEERLADLFSIQPHRTIYQDAPYGVQQLVDVALKALSPGINDPTTATMCVDHLCALMVRLACRRIPSPLRRNGGSLLVIAPGPDFESMTSLAFDAIAVHCSSSQMVFQRLVDAIDAVGSRAIDDERLVSLTRRLDLVVQCVRQSKLPAVQQEALFARASAVSAGLRERAGCVVRPTGRRAG